MRARRYGSNQIAASPSVVAIAPAAPSVESGVPETSSIPPTMTTIVIVVMLTGMLLVAGTPPKTLGTGVGIATALGVAAIWFEPYRRARIFSFINPWHDAQGVGKINYLPEAHTDMIFAVIGEELGLVGTTALIAAYVTFAYVGLRIALRCRDPFGKALASGLTILVCGQAAINLAAVMGLAPLTGIPLPFVSYGGSSLVVALASVGILLNIAGGHGAERRAAVPDRGRRDGRSRPARARRRRGTTGSRRARELRRVAGSRRGATRS